MERASGNYAFVRRVIEMKRAVVRNYAFVRRVRDEASEFKFFVRRELRLHSNANAKLRLRLVVLFTLVREELKAV